MGIWNLIYIYIHVCVKGTVVFCWFITPMKTSSLYVYHKHGKHVYILRKQSTPDLLQKYPVPLDHPEKEL